MEVFVESQSETSCGVWCPGLLRSSTAKELRLPRHFFAAHYQRAWDASALRTSSRHSLASMRRQRDVASSAGDRRWGPDHAFRQTTLWMTILWEDEVGEVHEIAQGEGGEQGDPLMPLLFSLGQHAALAAANARLQDGEKLLALVGL